MSDERHPSGHAGVDELRNSAGKVVGYLVDGCEFATLAEALAWRDDPDRASDLLAPPAPKRGPRR